MLKYIGMNNINFFGEGANNLIHVYGPVFAIVALWSIFWKGLALWHSAKRREPVWFIVFLLVNTLGILEIVYLFFILKLKAKELFSK